jgi:hypothetical protein
VEKASPSATFVTNSMSANGTDSRAINFPGPLSGTAKRHDMLHHQPLGLVSPIISSHDVLYLSGRQLEPR